MSYIEELLSVLTEGVKMSESVSNTPMTTHELDFDSEIKLRPLSSSLFTCTQCCSAKIKQRFVMKVRANTLINFGDLNRCTYSRNIQPFELHCRDLLLSLRIGFP